MPTSNTSNDLNCKPTRQTDSDKLTPEQVANIFKEWERLRPFVTGEKPYPLPQQLKEDNRDEE